MADRFHWLWEWLLSHLAWEGLKWIIPPAAVAMVVAIIATVLHWITGHASIVQVTLTFIGSILVTALIVGREKARRIAPRLKSYEARSEGLYDIQDNIIGFTQRIENDQQRVVLPAKTGQPT